jgi:hypothetical protein
MWFLFPILVYIIKGIENKESINIAAIPNLNEEQLALLDSSLEGWGLEFTGISIGVFSNYIQKGRKELFEYRDIITNKTFVELLLDMIDRVYEVSLNGDEVTDAMCATRIYISLIENFKGTINEIVILIIEKCMVKILSKEFELRSLKTLLCLNIEVVAMAFWYNP